MHFNHQIQRYKSASQTALAAARQFTDYLDRAAIYKGIPLRESDVHRQTAQLLQQACQRMEDHIKEHLNVFTLNRMSGNRPVEELPAMILLEKELAPRLAEYEQDLAECIDSFLLSLCEGLGAGTMNDLRFLQSTLRLRCRLNGNPAEETFARMARAASLPYDNLMSLLTGREGH